MINGHPCSNIHGSYKFKNTIKQRFSAEHGGQISPNESFLRYQSSNGNGEGRNSIPVFVLEPRGTCYLPICLPKAILEPYLKEMIPVDSDGGITQTLQYPVTISVSFRNCR